MAISVAHRTPRRAGFSIWAVLGAVALSGATVLAVVRPWSIEQGELAPARTFSLQDGVADVRALNHDQPAGLGISFTQAISQARLLNVSPVAVGAVSFSQGIAHARLLNESTAPSQTSSAVLAERIAHARALNQPTPGSTLAGLMEGVADARALNR